MKFVIEYAHDKDSGVTTCEITDKVTGKIYVGAAMCHPDDADMMSEKTGQEIAYRRAEISLLQAHRAELKLELRSLKQLYYSMDRSKNFKPKSYEARMLFRQMNIRQDDIDTYADIIESKKLDLKNFIDSKDDFYKNIRANRTH